MYDRLFAGVLLGLSGLLAWAATQLQVPFQYEPLGPKAFPIILAGLMAACAIWIMVKPSPNKWKPSRLVLVRITQALVLMFIYAWLFEPAGFIIATTVVGAVFAWMFGEKPLGSFIYALVMSVVSYFLLTSLLQLNVPAGMLFGG
ncbi:tripartite tricarboxylate transporter TctB family protein [Balneatrix alpica]|uniref:Tripartite tricarboxylate transporter TctB family protein n=1 Tax=Balneatrix alpica TaxID=75684 RepID=A0ABV5ZDP6_9GAMM|nr:tripartite tricarboxylate transporter TctB family protein [Balneatrix alpica]